MRTKEERKQCKKGHETTIGKIIYGFLLFLPLIAIGVTCGYAMFNKNAYQSFGIDSTEIEYKQVEYNNLEYGKTYTIQLGNYTNFTNGIDYVVVGINYKDNQGNLVDISNYSTITFYNTNTISIKGSGQTTLYKNTTNVVNITFIYNGYTNNTGFTPNGFVYLENVENTNNNEIQNVFYYSVDKVTQSNMFSWSQNSIIYTGMSNFTTALSITNIFVPTILTYWLIISIVYFMYDIVLMMLTILHRKIHDLQDSI